MLYDKTATFVSCTKLSKEEFEQKNNFLNKSIQFLKNQKYQDMLAFEVFYNNTKNLTTCYNEALEKHKHSDIIVFLHDDVLIEDAFIYEKLVESTKTFDIVGLAGSQKFSLTSPVMWIQEDNRDKLSGAVKHFHNNELFTSFYGPFRKKCLVVDGLFMAVNCQRIVDKIKFDTMFSFHFYDLDICLQAFKNKMTVGTWDINVYHGSPGSYNDPTWKIMENKFINKWKNV